LEEDCLLRDFLKFCLSVVWRRSWVLVVLNWLFFCFIVFGGLLGQFGVVDVYYWPFGEIFPAEIGNAFLTVGVIFVFNLVLSSFVVVTLTGLAFFGLPLFFISFRAFLWGMLLNGLSTPLFLAALPVLILEGESYILAALAGVNLGLSWLKPKWVYKGEALTRSEAVKMAVKEAGGIYVLVAVSLLVAAVAEIVLLTFI
jgi:hypothetical protein